MNEMIQEAVLDSIESIEEQQLFAECEVLSSLAATYMKSAMIQEAASGLNFDGYEIVQEADEAGVDVKMGKDGTYTTTNSNVAETKKPSIISRILQWIKNAASAIRRSLGKFFGKLFKKKNWTKNELMVIAEKGGTVEFKNQEVAERLGLPMKLTKEDLSRIKGYSSAAGAEYRGGVSGNATIVGMKDVEVGFRLSFPMKGFAMVAERIYNATKYFEEAAEQYWNHQKYQTALNNCKNAVKDASKKTGIGFSAAMRGKATATVEKYEAIVEIWKDTDTKLRACENDITSARKRFDHEKNYSDVALQGYAAAAKPRESAVNDEKSRNAELQGFINAANDVMAATSNMLKMSKALKEELDDVFKAGVKTKEWQSKAADAMDEADADERFGANAEH